MGRKVKWTKETILKEAQKYKTRSEFQTNSRRAYKAAWKLGILDKVCSHMPKPKKWTMEKVKKEAKKFKTRNEFCVKSNGAYNAARKLGILDKVCSHMPKPFKWTKETISKEAKKYKTRKEFSRKSGGAYEAARKFCILDEVCSHMICGKARWTKETILKEAKKYKTRNEFQTNSRGAYHAARKLGILDEVCSHMKTPEFHKKRCVYIFVFEDNSFYVGLTYNFKTRHGQHKGTKRFINKIKKNISYTYEHTDLMPYKEAQKLEGEREKKYLDLGYKKLNISKTGSLGGSTIKWTKEKIKKEAQKYKIRTEFKANSGGAYGAALKLGILDEVCLHMPKPKKWTKKTISEEAKKYKTRNEFQTNSRGAYHAAWKLGILDKVCSHLVCGKTRWTKEKIKKEAKKYKTRNEFQTKSSGAYSAALKSGILDEVCSHMPTRSKNKNNVIKFPSKKASTYRYKDVA